MNKLFLIFGILLALAFVGCGSDSEKTAADTTAKATAQTTSPATTQHFVDGQERPLFVYPRVETTDVYLLDDAEMVELPSGVRYQDIVVGDGEAIELYSYVKYDYFVWFASADGLSIDRPFHNTISSNQPFFGQVGGKMIEGLSQGLVGMKTGGLRRIFIPSDLAYGNKPPFGGNNLIFEIDGLRMATLLEVEEYQDAYNNAEVLKEHQKEVHGEDDGHDH